MDTLFIRELLLCSFLFAAGISDMYLRKVRNRMIVFFFLLSIMLSLLWGEDPFTPLLPAFLIMLLLFPFYKRHMLGAADIKLIGLMVYIFPSIFSLEILFAGMVLALIFTAIRVTAYILSFNEKRGDLIPGLRRFSHFPLTPFIFFGAIFRFLI